MSYKECEKLYAEAVILVNKILIRLIDVTVEQWLDLKYGYHKTMDKNVKKRMIGTWLIKSYKLQFKDYLEIKKQRDTYAQEVDMEYNPSNLVFVEWLTSKFYNHLEMDWYTKNALWVYKMRGDDEVVLCNNKVSDLKDENNDDEHEIVEIFMIKTNLFDYETPLCKAFDEFNYLLKVDTKLFTHDIKRTKTYEDYMNEWNNELDEPYLKDKALKQKAVYEKSWGDATLSEEEYVVVKEYEYDDLTRTNKDACYAYQEIFHNMDEGWLVTSAE
uniref:Zf-BED domain-containing protein n=1 Tax=Tanacetum cinerariifolium TaxID=118510 RepID=A0A6L2K727_TANCI|nr:zf-BED domain-containing protein [Tanacetum cinerariifolium]